MNVVNQLAGIDELRCAVSLFNNGNETFAKAYSVEQLMQIWRSYEVSEWDIPPDQWTVRQVKEALSLGRAPTWAEEGVPTYDDADEDVDVRARAEEILETSADEDSCVLAHWVLEHLGVPYKGP